MLRNDAPWLAARLGEAKAAFEEAARLTGNDREREWLLGRATACGD